MKFTKQLSLISLILLSFSLLAVFSPLVAGEDIETIMTQGDVYALDVGSIYVLYPQESYQRDGFTVSLAFFQTSQELVEGDISLYRNGELLNSENQALDLENGDTYLLMEWNENLMENASYNLNFIIDGEEIFSKEFQVEVKEKTIVNRTVEQTRITEEDQSVNTDIKDLVISNRDYSNLEFDNLRRNAENHLVIEKTLEKETILFMDNTSLITSKIIVNIKPVNGEEILSMDYIEEIPKSIANSVSEIIFSSNPIVLKDDPIIMWHVETFNETQTFSYEVENDVEITGNTVLLANVASEQEKSFNWGILFALLLIPLIAGIIIYFSRFGPKK